MYRNGGPPFAIATDATPPAAGEAAFLGLYERVGGPGPDTPVYVSER